MSAAGDRSLWQFVPPSQYGRPELPVASAAVQAWETVRDTFKSHRATDHPAKAEQDLRSLTEIRLQHLVRPIDWQAASASLDQALGAAMAEPRAGGGVCFVVGQPYCGHAEIVADWASRHRARMIEPPSEPDLSHAPGALLEDIAHHPWALPRLEHCFLRRVGGLAWVRGLIEAVEAGRAGRGLIGCDSWAWAYLQNVWPVTRAPVLTLQAFDGPGLARLFADLASRRRQHALCFRSAHTGRALLTVPLDDESVSDELVRLAAHCRGNVGVARRYWRERLRAEPEEPSDEAAVIDGARTGDEVVWVATALDDPKMPVEADEDVTLALHALLLHNGLDEPAMSQVLGLPLQRCAAIVLRLRQLGLVETQDGRWTVAALAYMPVHAWLRSRDYLTDAF